MSAPLNTSEIWSATAGFLGLLGTLNHRMHLNRKTVVTKVEEVASRDGRAVVGKVAGRVVEWAEHGSSAPATPESVASAPLTVAPGVPAVVAAPVSAMPGAQS